jgi:hypothetical protein
MLCAAALPPADHKTWSGTVEAGVPMTIYTLINGRSAYAEEPDEALPDQVAAARLRPPSKAITIAIDEPNEAHRPAAVQTVDNSPTTPAGNGTRAHITSGDEPNSDLCVLDIRRSRADN